MEPTDTDKKRHRALKCPNKYKIDDPDRSTPPGLTSLPAPFRRLPTAATQNRPFQGRCLRPNCKTVRSYPDAVKFRACSRFLAGSSLPARMRRRAGAPKRRQAAALHLATLRIMHFRQFDVTAVLSACRVINVARPCFCPKGTSANSRQISPHPQCNQETLREHESELLQFSYVRGFYRLPTGKVKLFSFIVVIVFSLQSLPIKIPSIHFFDL